MSAPKARKRISSSELSAAPSLAISPLTPAPTRTGKDDEAHGLRVRHVDVAVRTGHERSAEVAGTFPDVIRRSGVKKRELAGCARAVVDRQASVFQIDARIGPYPKVRPHRVRDRGRVIMVALHPQRTRLGLLPCRRDVVAVVLDDGELADEAVAWVRQGRSERRTRIDAQTVRELGRRGVQADPAEPPGPQGGVVGCVGQPVRLPAALVRAV